jgi:hypothetical protein
MVNSGLQRRRFPMLARFACVAAAGLCAASSADAAVILTTTADAAVSGPEGGGAGTAVNTLNLATGRAGSNNSNNLGRAYIIPFQLPTLAAGQTFTSASFTVYFAANNGFGGALGVYPDGVNANFDADLYGLRERSSSTVLTSDYYQGSGSGTPTFDTAAGTLLLQHDFMTPSLTTPTDVSAQMTSTAGGASLAAYLNAEYALGGAGSYVFLRLSADSNAAYDPAIPAGNNGYNYAYNYFTFDQGTVNGQSVVPAITYSTAVPEPATAGLAMVASGVFLARRRRAAR